MPEHLNITADDLERAAAAGNDAALALLTGRLVASVKSRQTGEHITVQARCRRKTDAGSWEPADFRTATHVFLDVPGSGDRNRRNDKIGTYYPQGRQAGNLWADRFADRARLWAACFALASAAGRQVRTDQAEIELGSHCLACGRELTHPDSIRRNLGPDCAQKDYTTSHQIKNTPHDAPPPAVSGPESPARPEPRPVPSEALSGPEDAREAHADVAAYGLFEYRPGRSAREQLAHLGDRR